MKKLRSVLRIAPLFAAVILALTLWAGISPPVCVSANAYGAYGFSIEKYEVDMTVSPDRVISVEERITARLTGYDSHGIIRDFPLDGGVKYRNISAQCDSSDFSPYFQNDDSAFLSYYLRGKYRVDSGMTRTYTLTYEMHVPALAEEGYLPLDVIGYGWQTEIKNVTAKITVPDGLRDYKIYSGKKYASGNQADVMAERSGNTISLRADSLSYYYDESYAANSGGITLDLSFEKGVLSVRPDFEILWVVLLGAGVLMIAVLVKLFACRNPMMTATVNLEAPEEMDPMTMGKIIDNKIDSEDVGALVFWLAENGYLHIDLSETTKIPRYTKQRKNCRKIFRSMPAQCITDCLPNGSRCACLH